MKYNETTYLVKNSESIAIDELLFLNCFNM